MKLASLKAPSRDGQLVVVSQDGRVCAPVGNIAPHLRGALENWDEVYPALQDRAALLDREPALGEPFEPHQCSSPLPRSWAWADGSAYVNHVQLVRQARGAQMPESFWTDPLMYQGGSDTFLGPCDDIPLADNSWGLDLEAEIAVVTGDVPQGADYATALNAIRLVMLVNDVSLRNLIPAELAKGFGFFQSKPSSAFSPLALTPDALGSQWREGKLHGALHSFVNDQPLGHPDAGVDMTFDFPTLIMHAARTRSLSAGTIIGSGTVSNRDADGGPGRPVSEGGLGYSCLAEQRMVETILQGQARTPFLQVGDRVRIEMHDAQGSNLFGTIEQTVVEHAGA